MTNLQIHCVPASSQRTTNSDAAFAQLGSVPVAAASAPANHLTLVIAAPQIVGFTPLADYIREAVQDPEVAEAMEQARIDMADHLTVGGTPTMRTLRLRLGLSQAQLAERVATSQAQVARIETGTHDPNFSTIERFATALEIPITELVTAFIAGKHEQAA